MNTKSFLDSESVMRLIIMFSIFSSAFGVFLLYRLDSTIHNDLYNFGLQFDFNWALPTWTLERLLGVCLILPMVFGTCALVWDFRRSSKKQLVVHVEPKPRQPYQQQPEQSQQPQQVQQKKQLQPKSASVSTNNNGVKVKANALMENSMVISCPSCKKVFSKPLVMLDFSDKKTKLVNVCPYCNTVLGKADEEEEKADVEVGVLDLDEKTEKR